MKKVEKSARTAEEAIEKALEELHVNRSEVEVEILNEGKRGVLGIGAEEARVSVTLLQDKPPGATVEKREELVNMAYEILENILSRMGIEAVVSYKEQAVVQKGGKEVPPIVMDVEGDDLGVLIGRRGQTLACLQYIVRLAISNRIKSSVFVVVDVNSYKQNRYQALDGLAQRTAEEVIMNDKSFDMEPMPAYERRIIHLALDNNDMVSTESVGFGDNRRVRIIPRKS